MQDDYKLEKLEIALNKYCISIGDPEVQAFLNAKRQTSPNLEIDGKEMKYGKIIPTMQKVLPSYFENNSYLRHNSILDWYLYENSSANPLVWDNIGTQADWLKESFEQTKASDRRGVVVDVNGNYFNVSDANHRLLTLMFNHFMERLSAKTEAERQAVDEKYILNVPVSYPHDAELIDSIYSFTDKFDSYSIKTNRNSPIPPIVAAYRQLHGSQYVNYPVSYDKDSNMYTFDFNGEQFKGTAKEMTEYLNTKKISTSMSWQDDKSNYYRSVDTFVLKSKDKVELDTAFTKTGDKESSPYVLSIYDVDSKEYSIETESLYYDAYDIDKDLAQELISVIEDFASDQTLKQYADKGLNISKIVENVENDKYFSRVHLPAFNLKHLTKDEYRECYSALNNLISTIYEIKANHLSSDDSVD